jgi:3-hydroxyisobutyrate dehydrogenase-like beta-hydroxyacid dehydrogenase
MQVAFLGTGLMGAPMAERLLAAGHRVTLWNRTPAKAAALEGAGARVAPSAPAALAAGDWICAMLADAAALEAVVLAPEARERLAGRSLVQMGTIAPAESRALAAAVTQAGGAYLEAPVLGSIPEARAGRLQVMVGAADADFAAARELLCAFGPEPLHVGPVGQAAALKLALNQLIAALTTAFSLSLSLVEREGVPVETFMGILRGSALYAPTFDKKLPRMGGHTYADPNFPARHLLKDLRLVLEEARRQGLATGTLEAVGEILEATLAAGRGDEDYSVLHEAVRGEP